VNTTQLKGFNGDKPFQPQVSIEEIENFEKADAEAASPAQRLRVREAFVHQVLKRTATIPDELLAPEGALNARGINATAYAIYTWPFSLAEDDAPLA
jgi:hypothetical protein